MKNSFHPLIGHTVIALVVVNCKMIINGSIDRQLETLLDEKDYQLVTCDPLVLCPFQTYGSRQFLALDILIENKTLETGQKDLSYLFIVTIKCIETIDSFG